MSRRRIDARGYVRVGSEYEHRLVAEQTLGRRLRRDEVVHHINGDKQDNRPVNLRVMKRGAHVALHNAAEPKRPKGVVYPREWERICLHGARMRGWRHRVITPARVRWTLPIHPRVSA